MNETEHMDRLKVCLDVQYTDNIAVVAAVLFATWQDAGPTQSYKHVLSTPSDYVSGEFYKRELPCLSAMIGKLPQQPKVIIIDGYVWLAPGMPGLGARLHESLGGSIPVIGAAKNSFRSGEGAVHVFRGDSQRPLYVTAAGMDAQAAGEHIRSMHGPNRIPLLIKLADQIARGYQDAPALA